MPRALFDYSVNGVHLDEPKLEEIAGMTNGILRTSRRLEGSDTEIKVQSPYGEGIGVRYLVIVEGSDVGDVAETLFTEAGLPKFVTASPSELYTEIEEKLHPYGKKLKRTWKSFFSGKQVIDL